MKNNGSMNRLFRVIWNAATGAWQAVTEVAKGKSKSSKRTRPALVAGAFVLMSATAYAQALPTGGTVVDGSATISQSGNNMTINQTTAKMAADWQSFSIGAGSTVTFNQPSASSVALNRVVGADVSLIQGALKANGQVFLLNPNGVLFTPTAQVDVGGIVASTLSLSTADFMDGNYKFAGSSSNAIVNQGNITTVNGGTIALIAAKITNNGTLTANGGNVLLGAGSQVTLDLGGPVKLQVTQGAIDALIQNGGAIKADGGLVYLTAKAAGALTSTVINNTGVIEAQTLASGEKGAIYLMGGMENDRIVVGGKLDASAPNGGDGGFIETSAAHVKIASGIAITTKAANGSNGTWLIDPVDFTIATSGGDITGADLAAALEASSVVIETAAGASTVYSDDPSVPGNANGNSNGDIFVFDTIAPSLAAERSLTLKAGRNIEFGDGNGLAGIITATGDKLHVYLSAGNDGGSGDVRLNAGSSITTNGGDILIGGALDVDQLPGGAVPGSFAMYGTSLDAGAGAISIKAQYIDIEGGESDSYDNPAWGANDPATQYEIETNAPTYKIKGGTVYLESTDGRISTAADTGGLLIEGANAVTLKSASYIDLEGTDLKTAGILTMESQEYTELNRSSIDVGASGQTILKVDQSMTAADIATEVTDEEWALFDDSEDEARFSMYRSFANLHGGAVTYTWGSDGTPTTYTPKVLNNSLLAFGNGLEDSINNAGMLKQPFYYSEATQHWVTLTYGTYPLDINIGINGSGYADGDIVNANDDASAFGNLVVDYANFSNGMGRIDATNTVTINGTVLEMKNSYTLNANQAFVKADTLVKNVSGSDVDNIRVWSGTRDDNVGGDDSPTKVKGNLTGSGFQATTDQSDQAKAVLIYKQNDDGVNPDAASILFYSTSSSADVTIGECCDPNFHQDEDGEPLSSPRDTPMTIVDDDGNYSVTSTLGNMVNNASGTMQWYYGAGSFSSIADIVGQVADSAGVTPPVPPPVTPPVTPPAAPQIAAIQIAQNAASTPTGNVVQPVYGVPSAFASPAVSASLGGGDSTRAFTSGGLNFLLAPAPEAGGTPSSAIAQEGTNSDSSSPNVAAFEQAGMDPSGFMKVFVVGGGVRLPEESQR